MTEMFTVELPDAVAHRVQQTAERTGRPVEAVLAEWIERSVLAEEFSPLIPGAEYPIYTPVGNEAAAAVLMKLLKETEDADKKAKP